MEVKELNEALEGIKAQVATSTAENKTALEGQIKALETKLSEAVEQGVKQATEALQAEIKAVQDHADNLDVKMQAKANGANEPKPTFGKMMRKMIAEKFEDINAVGGATKSFKVDTKAVGDMTLGNNLTGDEPRDYNFDVAMKPGQNLNFADLVSTVNITGGTYTFVRETTSEGAIATQTEGAAKSQIDYDTAMIDVSTDFLAGFAVYSKKMRNNLPYLESFLPRALRRDYFISENAQFVTALAAEATASTVITGNHIERLISNISALESINYMVNGIVITPADYWTIMTIEKSTGAGYGLPGIVTIDGGQLRINGIPIYKATWLAANKYFVGDWSYVEKVVTEGLSLEFSTEDSDNFRKNNITARIEAQIALAVRRPDALVYGDFTTVA